MARSANVFSNGGMGILGNSGMGIFGNNGMNDLICSLESGSCGKCMKIDKERLGLPDNCLLNFQGRICYFASQKKKLGCGIAFKN
jgi:hypothetical protein